MKLSIVTPTLNQARFIPEAIESVLTQDYPFVEYLVVDGGSTDGTIRILESYGERLQFVLHPGERQSASINAGFAMASGEVLAWLNSDDRYEPGALGRAMEFLRTHPEVDVVYGDCQYIDAEGRSLGAYPSGRPDPVRWIEMVANEVPQPATFVRRKAVESVNLLDPSLDFVMDFDLWLRLATAGHTFFHLDSPLAALRLHGEAKSVRGLSNIAEELVRVFERVLGSPGLPAALRKGLAESNVLYRAAQLYFWSGSMGKAQSCAWRAFLRSPLNVRPTLFYSLTGSPARHVLERWHGNPFRRGVR